MLTDEAFQKLLFDLFCLWHDVQRHFDPPINSNEEEKLAKVRKLICKLLNEIDSRVKRIRATPPVDEQEFIEEWTNLTWNTLCITSRMQTNFTCPEDRVIYTKLNLSLIELVNNSRSTDVPPTLQLPNETLSKLSIKLTDSMEFLHQLYRQLKNSPQMTPEQTTEFDMQLRYFASHYLIPFIDFFKSFCNEQSTQLWADVRSAQVQHVVDRVPMAHAPVNRLVSFYSYMMHKLAVLGARLQGFRYELTTINKVFGEMDPVKELSDNVFTALELLMSDCILTTDPSTNTILVTNNLFSINCGALARGVVFKNFDVQLITEDTAEQIQSEMRRQKMLQQPSPIGVVPSAALLAMKPTSGTKRSNSTTTGPGADLFSDAQSSSAHKKSDVNSKETVTIYPIFNAKNRYWAATYPQLLCTTRQKGRQSTNSSFQDLSPSAINDPRSSGKRPIFYFYICATMFSPSGRFADAHTLSLPITIATRRNQDCQVQRMMSSYTATCFWLYGTNVQDGLLLQWSESGMSWDHFKSLFKNHFRVNAEIQRGLEDRDFELLQYKLQCNDCSGGSGNSRVNNAARVITFKNMLCPHLRYECGSTNVRFSVWRGLLEVLQIFQDQKTNVRKLWEKGLVLGFLEFDQVAAILSQFDSALIMRLSFITGGTICFTVKTNTHSLMHLEPLDLKKLQGKCLKDYLRDISVAEKVKYIINSNGERVLITDIIDELNDQTGFVDEMETGRSISSNVTHSGDIDSMQNITFTAMRIAVVTCKVKPPSSDMVDELQNGLATGIKVASPVPSVYPNGQLPPLPQSISNQQAVYKPQYNQQNESLGLRLPANATSDDFARELIQLCNFHGKSRNELMSLLNQVPENLFCIHSNYSSNMNVQPNYLQYSPPINTQMVNQAPIFQSNNLPNGANNRQKFSHSPSPMNTSPTGSSTLISSQPGSIMAPLSIGNMDPSLSMDQSTPPANTPNGFMTFGQL